MKRKGVSLYFVMVILFLLLGVALGISTVITSQIVMIRLSGDSVIAEAAAETGVEEGLYMFYRHGYGTDSWVDGLDEASTGESINKKPFTLCGICAYGSAESDCGATGSYDPFFYTGEQVILGANSKYRYRFFYDKDTFSVTAAGFYPANKIGGKDISLRVVSGTWR